MNYPIKVYVAGPYSADNVVKVLQNIRDGINASARLFEMGYAPYCPWLDYHYVLSCNGDIPKERYQEASMAWLRASEALLLIGDWGGSKGTIAEIEEAGRRGIPIFTAIEHLNKWAETKNWRGSR